MRLGIDFGTTRTVVAFSDRGNYPVVSFLSDSGDATDWYPSVVAECKGELRFGFDALQAASDPNWTLVRSFKRMLTDPRVSPTHEVTIGSSQIALTNVLTGFLMALRRDLLGRSNLPASLIKRDPRMHAVVATPANAHSAQRFVTFDAFRRAGFEVTTLVNEPSAAGFEYAHRHRATITARREYVVVYDLGGGTFDASLVHMSGQHHDVITTAGIARLGGDDFDATLLELVMEEAGLQREKLSTRSLDLLTDQCRQAKEALNPNTRRIVIDLEAALGQQAPAAQAVVSTGDFYEACNPLIERTVEAMRPVMERVDNEERQEAATDLSEVAGVYVVGGASSLPAVARSLRKHFGRRVHRSPYPSAATAIGLAIAADEASGFQLTDRFSRTFGVFREALEGAQVVFDPIFTNEIRLPSPNQPFVSCRLYRPAHNIGHFRYIECASLDDNGDPDGDITPFADVLFAFDPALREDGVDLQREPVKRTNGEGPLVRERYSLDAHGIVEVTISDLDNGFERRFRLGNR